VPSPGTAWRRTQRRGDGKWLVSAIHGVAARGTGLLNNEKYVVASRGVWDDNPYSEALFRTLKHTPAYPHVPFADLACAERWVTRFISWYNGEHRHSAIRYVTPNERHDGREQEILTRRHELYRRARDANPERWGGAITTKVAAAAEIHYAEEYHQQYLAKNPNGYCGGMRSYIRSINGLASLQDPRWSNSCRKPPAFPVETSTGSLPVGWF
jgi:hypothetical protein